MNTLSDGQSATDREVSLKRLGGDEKLLSTLAKFFLEDAPGLMTQLHNDIVSRDTDGILRRAHSLRGLSATFEALPFQHVARELESLARSLNQELIELKWTQLKVEYERLFAEVQTLAR